MQNIKYGAQFCDGEFVENYFTFAYIHKVYNFEKFYTSRMTKNNLFIYWKEETEKQRYTVEGTYMCY